ncbi:MULTISPECIES: hypothetical protein [unclassified Duganella]|uniref:hypothetical protein n=1 Tax=unclassified Duganella TaxID=2636909 RepID=UPI0006FBEA84|nr:MULTISPECIES: hypothetical protein [unclassified Duganella]KQV53960.1 hypothetical protein ASD07_05285 [Duganella sp. Root336D2]KRB98172.1 hypothetical protein ASE26_24965 [Duganella sp. Root198D2]
MPLDVALKNFAGAFAAGSANFGTLECREFQPIVEPIPLGPVLHDYYGRLSMSDKPQVGGRLLLMLFTLDDLETCQHGWRWIRKNNGPVIDDPAWNKHWIVIAYHHGDAIVVDDSTASGVVTGHIGSFNVKIADDLASFFQVMAEAMTLEASTFNYEVLDEDFSPIPDFLNAVSAIARRVLVPAGEAGFMEFFFG